MLSQIYMPTCCTRSPGTFYWEYAHRHMGTRLISSTELWMRHGFQTVSSPQWYLVAPVPLIAVPRKGMEMASVVKIALKKLNKSFFEFS